MQSRNIGHTITKGYTKFADYNSSNCEATENTSLPPLFVVACEFSYHKMLLDRGAG